MLKNLAMTFLLIVLGTFSKVDAKITLKPGDPAPDFSLLGNDDKDHKLSDFKGQTIVLYFYPKDDTPGCTKEACSFRDDISEITQMGAKVIGVSVQDVKSHKQFTEKYGLNFLLLADPALKVVKRYGVLNPERKLASRVTFIIDPDGRIVWINPKVNPEGHSKEIIDELKKIKR